MRFIRSASLTSALAVAALGLAACGSGEDAGAADTGNPAAYGDCEVTGAAGSHTLDLIQEDTITVKADLPSPGWYNGDTVESIRSGFDFCLLANIAHRAGAEKIVLQNSSFDGLVAGKAGDFDLTLNQITITDERRKVMEFSEPYFQSTAGVLVKKDSTVDETTLSGSRIGVKQGTVGQILVADVIKPKTAPDVFPGDPEQQAAVAAGRIDAGIQDLSIVLGAAAQSGGALKVAGQIPTDETYGVMMPKGSTNVDAVNEILTELREDGTLDDLASTYLTEAYGVDPATIPVWKLQ
jgi:polar amino acid transport system substrate-binding protein